MKMTVLYVAAAAAGLSFAAAARGGVKVFDPPNQDGDWHVENNWDPPGIPGSSDRVIIPAGVTCRIVTGDADGVADTIQVEADRSDPDPINHLIGRLFIESYRTLTLYNATNNDGAPGPDHSLIDGEVVLLDGGGNNWLIFACPGGQIPTCPSHVVWGEGAIIGKSSTRCGIEIAAGVTLLNQLAEPGRGIRGAMTVQGLVAQGYANGKFTNEGLVEAAQGQLDNIFRLHTDTILADAPGARWKVGEPDDFYLKKMIFDREATNLKGDFIAHGCGELAAFVFNASVRTCGWHIRTRDAFMWCPGIDVNNGATFSYIAFLTSADPDEACANPGTSPGPGLIPCTNHYVVDSDVDTGPCGD